MQWIEAFKPRETTSTWKPPSRVSFPTGEAIINPSAVDAIAHDLLWRDFRQTGTTGVALRDLYRNLNFSAKQARQLAQDLVRAGLIEERRMDRAEWFIAVEHISEQT